MLGSCLSQIWTPLKNPTLTGNFFSDQEMYRWGWCNKHLIFHYLKIVIIAWGSRHFFGSCIFSAGETRAEKGACSLQVTFILHTLKINQVKSNFIQLTQIFSATNISRSSQFFELQTECWLVWIEHNGRWALVKICQIYLSGILFRV